MGKIIETHISRFDGGMTNDIRSIDTRYCRVLKHFDILTAQHKLTPFLSHEADGATGDTEKLCQFLTYGATESATKQYALGVKSGLSCAKVFERASIPTGAWTASTTGEDSAGARSEKLFVEYNGVIYGAAAGTRLWSYIISTNTFAATAADLTAYTNIAQGLVHSKDDILYIPYDNKIASKDGAAAFNVTALTLPTNCIITSICEYGNYLAIAVKPKFAGGKSTIFLWDMSSATWNEMIDWGYGNLELIEELEGYLIGIGSTSATSVVINPKILIKYWNGGTGAKRLLEFVATDISVYFSGKQKRSNRILFGMAAEIDNVVHAGIWSIGRIEGTEMFALSLDSLLNNDTTFVLGISLTGLLGFQLLGDYMTSAYKGTDGVYTITRTVEDKITYSASSVYESLIFNAGDSSLKKDLVGITVMTEELPSAGEVVLEYKKDEDIDGTTWTNIFTHEAITAGSFIVGKKYKIVSSGTTDFTLIGAASSATGTTFTATGVGTGTGTAIDDLISHSVVTSLPKAYKEIQFRIESTGGAEITGLSFKEEITTKDRPYD